MHARDCLLPRVFVQTYLSNIERKQLLVYSCSSLTLSDPLVSVFFVAAIGMDAFFTTAVVTLKLGKEMTEI